MADNIDWNAIDHADEVLEYLNVPARDLSLQERTEMGRSLLRMAAKRMIVEDAPAQQQKEA